jgi:hypothetical protein
LHDYRSILETVFSWVVQESSFECRPGLDRILRENDHLVILFSHASPLSWVPAACLMAREADNAGGGDRTPMGVMDRLFFQIPFVRALAHFITQSEKPLNFEELVAHFRRLDRTDLVIFPEGSNCFFGPPDEIQEFRSPRMIEVAIRARAPVLIGVHRGSEAWAKKISLKEPALESLDILPSFLSRRLARTGVFALPVVPKKIPHFRMLCELYRPTLRPQDLSVNAEECRAQIAIESERVRTRMIELLAELDARDESRPDTSRSRDNASASLEESLLPLEPNIF